MEKTKCIITSVSNKFFPSLLNFIGSLKATYPEHPHIYVYDLGLSGFLRREISKIENVTVLDMPHFVSHWRSCYTWKSYILNTPLADMNLYIDAGTQAIKSLKPLFDKIETQGYLLVSQGPLVTVEDVTPEDYVHFFDIPRSSLTNEIIAAGIVGFLRQDMLPTSKSKQMQIVLEKLYHASTMGLCIGFSAGEQWKNRGKNKNSMVRSCEKFRHDTTVLTLLVLKYMKDATVEPIEKFDGSKNGTEDQFLWSVRMNFKKLEYLDSSNLGILSKIYVAIFLRLKKINLWIKGIK